MNFLNTRTNKNSESNNTTSERRFSRFPKLVITGLASAGLFLAGCAEAKDTPPTPTRITTTTVEAAPTTPISPETTPSKPEQPGAINTNALKNIQEQAHERWPGRACALAFYKNGSLNIDVVDPGLMAAIEELAYQGNPDIVPASLAGQEPADTSALSPEQKEVIGLSASFIAAKTGHIDEPGGRIGICRVPQGTVLTDQSAYVALDRGPSTERTDR